MEHPVFEQKYSRRLEWMQQLKKLIKNKIYYFLRVAEFFFLRSFFKMIANLQKTKKVRKYRVFHLRMCFLKGLKMSENHYFEKKKRQ